MIILVGSVVLLFAFAVRACFVVGRLQKRNDAHAKALAGLQQLVDAQRRHIADLTIAKDVYRLQLEQLVLTRAECDCAETIH